MTSYFFDSSALVKRYVNELGSTWVRDITAIPAAI
jgi:predicted nucleic acid-binding protein